MKFCFSVYDMNGDGFIGRCKDSFYPIPLLNFATEVSRRPHSPIGEPLSLLAPENTTNSLVRKNWRYQ